MDYTASDIATIKLFWDINFFESFEVFDSDGTSLDRVFLHTDGSSEEADKYAIALAAYQDYVSPATLTIEDHGSGDAYAETIQAFQDQPFGGTLQRPVTAMWEKNPFLLTTDPYFDPYPAPFLTEIPGSGNTQTSANTVVYISVTAGDPAPGAPASPVYSDTGEWTFLGSWGQHTPAATTGYDVWGLSLGATLQLDGTWLVTSGQPVQIFDGTDSVPLAIRYSEDGVSWHTTPTDDDIWVQIFDSVSNSYSPPISLRQVTRTLLGEFVPWVALGTSVAGAPAVNLADRALTDFRWLDFTVQVLPHNNYSEPLCKYYFRLPTEDIAPQTTNSVSTLDLSAFQICWNNHQAVNVAANMMVRLVSRFDPISVSPTEWGNYVTYNFRSATAGVGEVVTGLLLAAKNEDYPTQPIRVAITGVA